MVTLRLCGFSFLYEDDLLLELCLVYGVGGLLLLGRCLWGEWLWVLWRSGVCLRPVFLSLLACLSLLGCLERLVLLSLWCILMLDLLQLLLSSRRLVGCQGRDGRLPRGDGSLVGWMSQMVVSYPNSICRCDHIGCIHHILCVGR